MTYASLSAMGMTMAMTPFLSRAASHTAQEFLSYTCTHPQAAVASGRRFKHASHPRRTTTHQVKTALRLSPALTGTSASQPLATPLISSQVHTSETVPPKGDTVLMLGGIGRQFASSRSNAILLRHIDYCFQWTFNGSEGQ
jgi:hypothetical protein